MQYTQYRQARNSTPAQLNQRRFATKKHFRIGLILVAIALIAGALLDHGPKPVTAAVVKPLSSLSVCIDPGHGGDDPGAQSGNLTEATLNLQVAFMVRQKLEARGYPVYMTRTTSTTLSHAQRAIFCNTHHASILVAIHQNDYPYGNADYSTALYYKPQDLALATAMANAAGKELGLSVTPPSYFVGGVLMHSTMPATLIESLFITNTAEAKALSNGDRLNQQAQGIVNGIVNYFQQYK